MATALQWAIPKQVREHDVRRMWLVVGSATVLTALYKVFPKAHFNAVQVGRTVWPDMIDPDRVTIHVAREGFRSDAKHAPPYDAKSNYDAKVWQFVRKQKGRRSSGTYVWNVAGNK